MKFGPAMKRIDTAMKAAADRLTAQHKRMAEIEAKNKELSDQLRARPGVVPGVKSGVIDVPDDGTEYHDGHVVIGLSEREKKRFNWGKCFIAAVTKDNRVAEFEIACMKAAAEKDPWYKQKTAQFTNPTNLGWLVTPEFMNTPIDLLRSALFMDKLGVQRYTGLRNSPFVKPRITGEGSAGWGPANEGTAATQSDGSMDQLQAFPHPSYASRQLSLRLIEEGPQIAEQIVRKGIIETHKRLIEKALIEGTGADGQPVGVNNITGINTVSFSGATGDSKQTKLREMIWAILTDNVPSDGMAWVMSPLVLSNLDRILLHTGGLATAAAANAATATPIGLHTVPSNDGKGVQFLLGGLPVYSSTNITASTTSILTLAAWPEVSYFEWGSPIIKFSAEGKTNVLANEATLAQFVSADVMVDHADAICTGTAFTY